MMDPFARATRELVEDAARDGDVATIRLLLLDAGRRDEAALVAAAAKVAVHAQQVDVLEALAPLISLKAAEVGSGPWCMTAVSLLACAGREHALAKLPIVVRLAAIALAELTILPYVLERPPTPSQRDRETSRVVQHSIPVGAQAAAHEQSLKMVAEIVCRHELSFAPSVSAVVEHLVQRVCAAGWDRRLAALAAWAAARRVADCGIQVTVSAELKVTGDPST